jgi:hypothetical protein
MARVVEIAIVWHQVHKVICETLGQRVQEDWGLTTQKVRDETLEMVEKAIANPHAMFIATTVGPIGSQLRAKCFQAIVLSMSTTVERAGTE